VSGDPHFSFFPLLALWERRGLLFAFFLLLALPALAQPPAPADSDPTLWPEPQRAFFQDGPGLLLSPEERSEILGLDEAGRERLIREFLDRDPLPDTPANELREGIDRRRRLVSSENLLPGDARAELLFLRGRPLERKVLDCAAIFKPLEIWAYPSAADGAVRELILYRPSPADPFRLWLPIDTKRILYTGEAEYWLYQAKEEHSRRIDRFFCPDSVRVDRATGIDGISGKTLLRMDVLSYDLRGRKSETSRSVEWARPRDRAAFLAAPEDLASWARLAALTPLEPEPARLEVGSLAIDFPRRQGQRLVSRMLLELPSTRGMATAESDGRLRVKLAVDGVLDSGGVPFETFRTRYRVSPPAPEEPAVLLLDRSLRPGQSFILRLRVEDETSGARANVIRGFRVPGRPETRLPAALTAKAVGGQAVAANPVTGPDTVLLLPLPAEIVLGTFRAETVVTGERIAKVVFLLDGQPQLTRVRPPYSAEVRLAELPREQVVRVEGYDKAGELVAWDQMVLNQARGRFRVLITDPARGARVSGKVLARAEVVVPEERRVEEVELRVNDRQVAVLKQPPWQREIQVPAEGDLAYLTVTARLDDGSRAEDVRFLRAPANLSEMEVDVVELFATALDGSGHPVKGLSASDFEVLEGGKPQQLLRFEHVDDLPLSLGIAIDTSFSMASSLVEAQRAAAGFVHNLLTPRDRCFTLEFGSRPALLIPPVDDVEAVALSLEDLRAFGRTALHDAIITSLYYFRAERGQRALVLLTDGDDTVSSTSWEDALAYARSSGVAIYTIGLGIGELKLGPRGKLTELAEATGGRAFFVDRADELAGVYGRIEEELRSRYFLAYSSDRPADANGFHASEVRLKRGLKARVSPGMYP
jgi:Ca-activated chloride channel family protein